MPHAACRAQADVARAPQSTRQSHIPTAFRVPTFHLYAIAFLTVDVDLLGWPPHGSHVADIELGVVRSAGGHRLPGIYDHLHLDDWPFSVVPRPELCTYIAGRPQLDADIKELLRHLSRRDTSSIRVFWSWFGAGKTHSLHYLLNHASAQNLQSPPVRCFPVYTEFPRSVRNFVDLYKAFANSIDLSSIGDAFLDLHTSPKPGTYYDQLLSSNPDLAAALRVFSTGTDHERSTASRWLRGDMVPLQDFRRLGISQRISTSDTAIRTLASIVDLLAAAERAQGKHGHRLIWAIDELQRLGATGRNAILDVNAGLHSLFNACPTGLSLVLSFSGQPDQEALPNWFSSELKDRMGVTKVMVMPPLQRGDAVRFVKDVIAHFRTEGSDVSPLFPFSPQSCDAILDFVESRNELRPRFIMDAFNAVLEQAEIEIEAGAIDTVAASFAKDVLKQHVIVSRDPGDQ